MAKTNKYVIDKENWKEFDRLVQRANRKILSNMAYIQREEIKSDNLKRALLSDYASKSAWHTEKITFSRSKRFNSESEYKSTLRHLRKWGDPTSEEYKDPADLDKGYYKAIIQSLTTVAVDVGGILDERGKLPRNITDKIRRLSLEQKANWFDHGDPSEHIEKNGFRSDDFYIAGSDGFYDTFNALLNNLRQLYPKKRKTRKDKGKRRKRKK